MANQKNVRIDQPNSLLFKAEEVLKKVGAEKFLHGAGEELQKAREAFFAYFFILTFRDFTKKDWWIVQPEQFPDLQLVSFGENPTETTGIEFEIVSIPSHVSSTEEMFSIIEGKFKKGYSLSSTKPLGLLILPNNARSEIFVQELNKKITDYRPFSEVWVTYLVFKNPITIEKFVTHALRPLPVVEIAIDFENSPDIYRNQKPPPMTERVEENGISYFKFTDESKRILQKEALKRRLGK